MSITLLPLLSTALAVWSMTVVSWYSALRSCCVLGCNESLIFPVNPAQAIDSTGVYQIWSKDAVISRPPARAVKLINPTKHGHFWFPRKRCWDKNTEYKGGSSYISRSYHIPRLIRLLPKDNKKLLLISNYISNLWLPSNRTTSSLYWEQNSAHSWSGFSIAYSSMPISGFVSFPSLPSILSGVPISLGA